MEPSIGFTRSCGSNYEKEQECSVDGCFDQPEFVTVEDARIEFEHEQSKASIPTNSSSDVPQHALDDDGDLKAPYVPRTESISASAADTTIKKTEQAPVATVFFIQPETVHAQDLKMGSVEKQAKEFIQSHASNETTKDGIEGKNVSEYRDENDYSDGRHSANIPDAEGGDSNPRPSRTNRTDQIRPGAFRVPGINTSLNSNNTQDWLASGTDAPSAVAGALYASRVEEPIVGGKPIPMIHVCFGRQIKRTSAIIAGLLLVLVIGSIVVPVSIYLVRREDPRETRRKEEIKMLVTKKSSTATSLYNPRSPQSLALSWMLAGNNSHIYPSRKTHSAARILQRYALAVFYYSTGGQTWNDDGSNNIMTSQHECNWSTNSIVCDNQGRLVKLLLQDKHLEGSIPPEIQYFEHIENFNLSRNFGLSGTLPSEMVSLSKLNLFDIKDNSVFGTLPPDLSKLQNLTHLILNNNTIFGTIPSEFGRMINLRTLNLGDNNIEGSIPSSIWNLVHLTILDLSKNRIDAHNRENAGLSSSIGNLRNLKVLSLHSNYFVNYIPCEIGKLTSLEELKLNNNGFTSNIPTEIGLLRQLRILDISYNTVLRTTIPTTIGQLTKLEFFSIMNNGFTTGTIPTEIGNLEQMRHLRLSGNQLKGTIPIEIGRLQRVKRVFLDFNALTGTIPSELGNAKALELLECQVNPNIYGLIPSSLGLLKNMQYLRLYKTGINGTIPSELGNLTNLVELRLDRNKHTGSIPSEIGRLKHLEYLWLFRNKLNSTIPSEFGSCANLKSARLWQNDLSGSLPSTLSNMENLEALDLSKNLLVGVIPSEVGNLTNLNYLKLHKNKLSGSIPTELNSLVNLEVFWLFGNQFNGTIPKWIGTNLRKLVDLGLDENRFVGHLPSELGELSKLFFLSLNNNNMLSGSIPNEFAKLTKLEQLWLHGTNLSGNISFLCQEDGLQTIKVDLNEVACSCCDCC